MCNFRLNYPQALEARRLYENNRSLRQIATRFDCSQFAVRSAVLAVGGQILGKAEGTRLCHGITLEHRGMRMTISEWARHLGRSRTTLASRYQAGKSVEQILKEQP